MVLVTIILDFVIISATKHPLLNTDLRQVSQTDRSFAIGIHRDPRHLTRSSLHLLLLRRRYYETILDTKTSVKQTVTITVGKIVQKSLKLTMKKLVFYIKHASPLPSQKWRIIFPLS